MTREQYKLMVAFVRRCKNMRFRVHGYNGRVMIKYGKRFNILPGVWCHEMADRLVNALNLELDKERCRAVVEIEGYQDAKQEAKVKKIENRCEQLKLF